MKRIIVYKGKDTPEHKSWSLWHLAWSMYWRLLVAGIGTGLVIGLLIG